MLPSQLESRLHAAVSAVLPGVDLRRVLIRPATDARFGDYQCNALMSLARERQANPRQLATEVAARLDVAEWCTKVEVAGAGFLNFHVRPEALAAELARTLRDGSLFFAPTPAPRTVVIDFSSPNVAKPMHVGHIRSTLLGAALTRILRLLGHRVITDNHLGDWGTQFGLLLVGWKTDLNPEALVADPFTELERIYKRVNARAKEDPAVLESARAELVKLQAGHDENRAIWQEMIRLSQGQFDTIYSRLGVAFDHTLGESFYNPWLGPLVERLIATGVARESQGAIAVLSDHSLPPKEDPFLVQRDGAWQDDPLIVRKSDGAANYATTDLATLEYRLNEWRADEILYVVGAPQRPHFDKLFAAFRRWQPEAAARVKLVHVWFGSILGEDGKPFRTRSGDTVKLAELLDESEERAGRLVAEKRPDLTAAERSEIARVVGLGAVKYQDLLANRESDYTFSWDKMLALQGNTAPYLQYQYTRAAKVSRDGGFDPAAVTGPVVLQEPAELALARQLINFGFSLAAAAEDYKPNLLCNYLYETASWYSKFYEACPVLKAEEPVRSSRLALCHLTARVLRQGLDCLGIEVADQM